MTETELQIWLDEVHPVDLAQAVEKSIDADLPYPVVIRGGDVDEVRPCRPANLTEEDMPF